MNSIFTLALLAFLPTTARAADLAPADLYNCTGEDGLQVSFLTTSMLGQPQLSVRGRSSNGREWFRPDLKTTPMGYQASAGTSLAEVAITYTLIVPIVMVGGDQLQETGIHGMLVTSKSDSRDAGHRRGAVQQDEFAPVECTAVLVKF